MLRDFFSWVKIKYVQFKRMWDIKIYMCLCIICARNILLFINSSLEVFIPDPLQTTSINGKEQTIVTHKLSWWTSGKVWSEQGKRWGLEKCEFNSTLSCCMTKGKSLPSCVPCPALWDGKLQDGSDCWKCPLSERSSNFQNCRDPTQVRSTGDVNSFPQIKQSSSRETQWYSTHWEFLCRTETELDLMCTWSTLHP